MILPCVATKNCSIVHSRYLVFLSCIDQAYQFQTSVLKILWHAMSIESLSWVSSKNFTVHSSGFQLHPLANKRILETKSLSKTLLWTCQPIYRSTWILQPQQIQIYFLVMYQESHSWERKAQMQMIWYSKICTDSHEHCHTISLKFATWQPLYGIQLNLYRGL